MIFGNSDLEQHRVKLGLAFLVVGIVLVLWAWGSWIFRATSRVEPGAVSVAARAEMPAEQIKAVRAAPSVLLTVGILVLVFLGASLILVRASRRYRLSLTRRPAPPTSSSDVWAMNRPKSFDDSDA